MEEDVGDTTTIPETRLYLPARRNTPPVESRSRRLLQGIHVYQNIDLAALRRLGQRSPRKLDGEKQSAGVPSSSSELDKRERWFTGRVAETLGLMP